MPESVFYSWQSDLPNATNRGFIQTALDRAAKELRADDSLAVSPVIDRDTQGVAGAPDISASILEKIDESDCFVADVSLIGTAGRRSVPNPNVIFELGYAAKSLGWNRILLVMNEEYGGPAELPFDLKARRVICYRSASIDTDRADARRSLQGALVQAVRAALASAPEKASKSNAGVSIQDVAGPLEWLALKYLRAEAEAFNLASIRWEIAAITDPKLSDCHPRALLDAAADSMIPNFGYPIAVMERTDPDLTPKPAGGGIQNRVDLGDRYDYWNLRTDGLFYLNKSTYEERIKPGHLLFDVRIKRTGEALLYLYRLYSRLGLPPSARVRVQTRYDGLTGIMLSGSGQFPAYMPKGPASPEQSESAVETTLQELGPNLVPLTRELTEPLFVLFDYAEFGEPIYEKILRESLPIF